MQKFTVSLLILVVLAGCQTVPTTPAAEFSINKLNPDTLVNPEPFGYSHVVTVNNGRMIYLAGQGPTTRQGNRAGTNNLIRQTRQAVDNILNALAAVDAGPENIVYLRINVVDYEPKMMLQLDRELDRLRPEDGMPPASTMVGVDSLVVPGTLIEIETVAAIP